jgi:hypothetical protein
VILKKNPVFCVSPELIETPKPKGKKRSIGFIIPDELKKKS